MKKNIALVAALLLGSALAAKATDINFDKGVDTKGILENIKSGEIKTELPDTKAVSRFANYTRDCAKFSFTANTPLVSPVVTLNTMEYVQECFPVPAGPNGQMTQQCHQRPGMSWHENTSINITADRKLLPWEVENFTVCLEGPWKQIYLDDKAYNYGVRENGDVYLLTPGDKVAMNPDPNGITAVLTMNGKDSKVTFSDKWASYYAGGQVEIALKVRREIPIWVNATPLEQTFTFASADSYTVPFDASGYHSGKYYAEFSIKRLGTTAVSTEKQVKAPESARVEVK